jgi:predicted transcriptional regulator
MISMVTKIKKNLPDNTQLGVRLEPEMYKELEELALREDRTLAQQARIAIREYLERKRVAA